MTFVRLKKRKLFDSDPEVVFVNPAQVAAVIPFEGMTLVCFAGGWNTEVAESAEEVLATLISAGGAQ